jgi:hypothetical protein
MTLVEFLAALDERRAPYRLNRVRDAIMVEIATPGQRWEVEFMDDGGVEIEVFASDGTIADANAISELLSALD